MAYIYGKNERLVSDAKMLVQDLVVVVKEGTTTIQSSYQYFYQTPYITTPLSVYHTLAINFSYS